MTTPSNHRRPATLVAVAATSVVVALLAGTPTSASAIPEPVDRPAAAAGRNAHTNSDVRTHVHYVERACFIKPSLSWNKADGPLPRCYTYVR